MKHFLLSILSVCLWLTPQLHSGFQEFEDEPIGTDVKPYDNSLCCFLPFEADVTFVNYQTESYWSNHGTKHHVDSKFRLYQAAYAFAYNAGPLTYTLSTAFDNIHDPRLGNRTGFEDFEFDISSLWQRCDGTEATLALRTIIPSGKAKREIRFGRFGVGLEFSEIRKDCEDALVYGSTVGYLHYFGFPSDRVYYNLILEKSLLPWITLAGEIKIDFSVKNGSSQGDLTLFYNDPNERVIQAQLRFVTFAFENMQFDVGGFWNIWGRNVGTGVGLICHASASW